MNRRPRKHRLVVCVRNDANPVDLELRKLYRAIPDREAESHGMLRVIDESGEDYLFPAAYFVPVHVRPAQRKVLPFETAGRPRHGARRPVRALPRKGRSVPLTVAGKK